MIGGMERRAIVMKTAYIHCTLLDGSEDMIPQENMTVVEEEGKILEIGGDIVPEPGDKVIDLGGRSLMARQRKKSRTVRPRQNW